MDEFLEIPVVIQSQEVLKNVYHLMFDSQLALASTFLRFQEYYESPKFRGLVFTLDDYKAWYISVRGRFSYYTDWNGFNIPGEILIPFYKGKFDPLTTREQQLLDIFRDKMGLFYIIGTQGNKGAFTHELAHALYYTNEEYKQEVLSVIQKVPWNDMEMALLERGGYAPEVIPDEIQAYLVNGIEAYTKKIKLNKWLALRPTVRDIYNKYYQLLERA